MIDLDDDAERDRQDGQADLAGELPAGPKVEQVVDGADEGGRDAADEEGEELARLEAAPWRGHRPDRSSKRTSAAADDEEGDHDGDARRPGAPGRC